MYTKDLNYINYNIRKLRERDFLSQEYMAAKMGIGQNAYSKLELGKTKITLDRLFAIADILGVTVFDLLNPNSESQKLKIKQA